VTSRLDIRISSKSVILFEFHGSVIFSKLIHFCVFLFLTNVWIDLKVLCSLNSILGLKFLSLFFVDTVSANNSCDNNDHNRESNWHDEDEWVLILFKLNDFRVCLYNDSLVLLSSVLISIDGNSHVVVRHTLFN